MSDDSLIYVDDARGERWGDVLWIYETPEAKRRIAVLNARWGMDGDDSGVWPCPEYDGWTIDGHEPTDDESDKFGDLVYTAVRRDLNSTR